MAVPDKIKCILLKLEASDTSGSASNSLWETPNRIQNLISQFPICSNSFGIFCFFSTSNAITEVEHMHGSPDAMQEPSLYSRATLLVSISYSSLFSKLVPHQEIHLE
jgi:hypothetical protein